MWTEEFKNSGFVVIHDVVQSGKLDQLLHDIADSSIRHTRAGARHAMSIPAVRELANDSHLMNIARKILGPGAMPIRPPCSINRQRRTGWLYGIRILPFPCASAVKQQAGVHGRSKKVSPMLMHPRERLNVSWHCASIWTTQPRTTAPESIARNTHQGCTKRQSDSGIDVCSNAGGLPCFAWRSVGNESPHCARLVEVD